MLPLQLLDLIIQQLSYRQINDDELYLYRSDEVSNTVVGTNNNTVVGINNIYNCNNNTVTMSNDTSVKSDITTKSKFKYYDQFRKEHCYYHNSINVDNNTNELYLHNKILKYFQHFHI